MQDAVLNVIIKATDQATKTADSVSGSLDKLSGKIASVANKSIDTGKDLTAKLTLPILGIGAASFKTAADFDKSMRQVGAATGAPAAGVKDLTDLAIKMGQETTFSAGDAADAMLELAKGGITEAQIKAGALASTLTLAAAGGLKMGDAAGYISNALNTFQLDATQSSAVAAAFAGGANASTASVESLGQALSQVGPGAKLAGLSIQETVGALAAFDNAGIKGSDAGTSLKTMLLGLVPSTKEAKDMMDKYGLSFVDANGKIKPLNQVAEQLKTKLGGLTNVQKQQALQTIFGTDAFRAAAVLMDEGAAGVDKYTTATSDLAAAENMAKVGTEGASGSIEAMSGSLETAAIKAGTALAPIVTQLADKVGALADRFTSLNPEQQKTILIIAGIVAAIGPGLIALGAMAKGFSAVVSTASAATKAVSATAKAASKAADAASMMSQGYKDARVANSAFSGVAGTLGGKLKIVSSAFVSFGKAASMALVSVGRAGLALLANPVFLAITAAVLVIAGLAFLIIKNWDTVKTFLVNLWQTVYNAVATAMTAIWAVIEPIINFIIGYFKLYLSVVEYVFSVIRGLAIVVFNFLWNSVIKPIIDFIIGYFNFWLSVVTMVFNAIKDVATSVWNWIWSTLISPIINLIVGAANWMGGVLTGVWNWVKDVASTAWNGIVNGFSWAWTRIVGVWNAATGFFSGIWNSISGAMGRVADSISNAFQSGFDAAKNIAKGAVNWMIDQINKVINGVNSTAGKLPGVPKLSNIPRLAEGGIVTKPTLAVIGEGNESEAVVPLSKLRAMMGGGGGSTTYGATTVYNNFNTAEAVREYFAINANDNELVRRGLTPRRGY